jgi:deoxyribodipyrimidine photo-lyase
MINKNKINFFWFRRDLRVHDNTGLAAALRAGLPVQCVFIFDKNILDKLETRNDARLVFIHQQLQKIDRELRKAGGALLTWHGDPLALWKNNIREFNIHTVFTNHDYEPYARERDAAAATLFSRHEIGFQTFKDQVIFEKDEIVKNDGTPYSVFTPYKKQWLTLFSDDRMESAGSLTSKSVVHKIHFPGIMTLEDIGFENQQHHFPAPEVDPQVIRNYARNRDFPAADGTSRISIHLRFGTVSIRDMVRSALKAKSDAWLNELIWREYYMMILWHYPHVATSSFKKQYDRLPWRNNAEEFKRWCEGNTGYPIVDAGMRELNATGFMHNRVRMIVASFLTKHLLIDWRWGEAYFASKLLDYELSSNSGGWQWAAGCGCDAAPYFRIFNPTTQTLKFDPHFTYVRKWVPEFEKITYSKPMVDHHFARERCLETYRKIRI